MIKDFNGDEWHPDIEQVLEAIGNFTKANNTLTYERENSDNPEFGYLASHLYDDVSEAKERAEVYLNDYIDQRIRLLFKEVLKELRQEVKQ